MYPFLAGSEEVVNTAGPMEVRIYGSLLYEMLWLPYDLRECSLFSEFHSPK